MSLILDALNRSRDSSPDMPTLETQHPVESVRVEGRQYVPWVVLAVALVLIVWLLWNWMTGEPEIETPPATGSPVAELTQNIGSAASSITSELKARAEARGQGEQSSTQRAPEQQVVSGFTEVRPAPVQAEPERPPAVPETEVDSAAGAESSVEEAAVSSGQQDASPAAPENPEVARLYRDRSVPEAPMAAPAGKPVEQPLAIEDVLEQVQEEMGNAGLDDHPVPLLSSLSQQTKNKIPTLYYQQHEYSSEPARSQVTLNGKTVRVGGSPASGLKVEEILPNSVVLNYRGTQFRLRALNSWINL